MLNKFSKKFIAVIAITTSMTACLTNQAGELDKTAVVGVAGAVTGGVLGASVGRGLGNTAAIIGGTLIGGMLGTEVGKSLDKADIAYHNRTQTKALESNKTGASSSWKNPDTGASGMITPTKTFENNGSYCREFTHSINVGGKIEKGYGTACRQPDGSWQLAS